MSGKSITKRMFIGIVGVVIGFSVLVLAANTLLLKPLYYNRIKNSMIESISSYSDVDFSATRDIWIDSIFMLNAGKPYDIVVESGSRVIFSSSTDVGIKERPPEDFITNPDDSFPINQHFSKPPGPDGDWRTVNEWSEAEDSIYIGGFTDERSGQEFMVCRTQFDESITIYLMQPIEPISDSISQANILLIICTIIVLILSIVFAFRFSRRFTKPIKEIQGRVEEISNLDFSKSLEVKTGDELENLAGDVNVLSERLESSLEELKQKNLQLEKDIVAQKRFIANASHELRTPLSLIKGYTEELSSGFVASKEQQEIYLGIISEESTKIKRMINEMLDLSRLESGRMELNPEEFILKEKLEEFVDKYSGFISKNNLEVSLESDKDTKCSYDLMRFEQILANFLSNAAKYSDEQKIIIITAKNENDFVKINFYNSGKPIDESVIENIWDGFYKDPNSLKNESDSFGLGLSIVRAIQDVAGCGYGVKNKDNGVTFWFTVPLV